jgi:hypothetical protein
MALQTYSRPATIYEQAHQLWPILTSWVVLQCHGRMQRAGIITYGEAATYMGYPPNAGRTLGRPLGIISNFCSQNGIPRLNSIVVDFETGTPGDGIPVDFKGTFEDMQKEVFKYDWFGVIAPTRRSLRDTGL